MQTGTNEAISKKILDAYELQQQKTLKEIDTQGYLFRHKKSGARIVFLSNQEENKVFSIGFRTPPSDSTGVAHIVEHTVLCGSRKFPAKDPFIELAKGSMNTFLNAMTFSDKTIYPVASCNQQDFRNLMDVYLDAVFYPNIYQRKEIFQQEAWHYTLEKETDQITYNGVVYNEMKGAFSSPEEILSRMIQQSLFPDTPYGKESGGDPDEIPNLTYEAYLQFHRMYYHPSNSYIYFYGDLDIEETLSWLDTAYLSDFEKKQIDSTIALQPPFSECREQIVSYSITEQEGQKEKTYLSYNFGFPEKMSKKEEITIQILQQVLLEMPGAPLKQALLQKKIGKDIESSYDTALQQPLFSIISKYADADQKDAFLACLRETMHNLVNNGIEEKAIRAALHAYEFRYREADFGSYPKGLMYGIQILETWLYEDTKPFVHFELDGILSELKDAIGTGYYEQFLQRYFLDNSHTSVVILQPEVGLTEKKENHLKEKLCQFQKSLSQQQIQQLIQQTRQLRQYGETPSEEEALAKIPRLQRTDLKREARKLHNEERTIQLADSAGGKERIPVLYHAIPTNQIGYLKLLFDLSYCEEEDLPYIGLLATVLGYVDTKRHTFQEYATEVDLYTGGIFTSVTAYATFGEADAFQAKFEITAKAFYQELGAAISLIQEMLQETDFSSTERLYDILLEIRSKLRGRLQASGHTVASLRAQSVHSPIAAWNERVSGISYYQFIESCIAQYETKKQEIIKKLEQLMGKIFCRNILLVSYTAQEQGYEPLEKAMQQFISTMPVMQKEKKVWMLCKSNLPKTQAFTTAGKVQYVARTGNFIRAGFGYTGILKLLKVILNYDYLWIQIRVKGGAYGCGSAFYWNGNVSFASYRDPNLRKTDEVYDQITAYIKDFHASEEEMTKYIIGTIGDLDTPLTPATEGNTSMTAYLCGITQTQLQQEREQILNATEADIQALANCIDAVLKQRYSCVIGNEQKILEEKTMFQQIQPLFS